MTHPRLVESWPPASRRRRLLAIYLDFLLLGGPLHLAFWALQKALPAFAAHGLWLKLGWFALLEFVLLGWVKWSPGNYALGIELRPPSPFEGEIGAEAGRDPRVDPGLHAAERWWTAVAGVLFVLDGSKLMVRWTEWSRPMPFFGVALDPGPSAVLQLVLGIAECAIGVGVLRLRPAAPLAGIGFHLFILATLMVSWSLLPEWIAQDTINRRAAQGQAAAPDEIELMKAIFPTVTLVTSAIGVVWMAFVTTRTRSRDEP